MASELDYTGPELSVKYIKGTGPDFVVFIQSKGDLAQLKSVDGHMRWIVTEEDGTQVIYRPELHDE